MHTIEGLVHFTKVIIEKEDSEMKLKELILRFIFYREALKDFINEEL